LIKRCFLDRSNAITRAELLTPRAFASAANKNLGAMPGFVSSAEPDYAGIVFRFLRHPSRPRAPRLAAKSGSVAGNGVAMGSKFCPERGMIPFKSEL
jgi:hypothetical protein